MAEAPSLTADDYDYLHGLLLDPDPAQRAEGLHLAKKLTPQEQQAFFTFQQQATRGRDPTSQREDVNVMSGVPVIGSISPEAVLGGVAIGRHLGQAITNPNLATTAGRVAAGARAVGGVGWNLAKFEGVTHGLEWLGVPPTVAGAIAHVIVGRPGRAGSAPAEAEPAATHLDTSVPVRPSDLTAEQLAERIQFGTGTPTARAPTYAPRPTSASVEPPASAPAVPGPPSAPATPQSVPTPRPPSESPGFGWSPQRIRNEVGLAARRMNVTLTEPQAKVAEDLVATGRMPTAAVAEAAPVKVAAAPDVTPPAKPKVLAAEMKEYSRLRRLGKSHTEAVEVLQAQRELARRLGTPTSEAVRQTIVERNLSGEWPE